MPRFLLSLVLTFGVIGAASAQDPGLPDSMLVGCLDSVSRDDLIVGLGQTVLIPVWMKTDDSVIVIHVPVATEDEYITSREGGILYDPLTQFDDIGFLPPESDQPFGGYTSQSLLGFAYLVSSKDDPPILPYFLTYRWFHACDFMVTTTTDTSALGCTTAPIEGNSNQNGGLIFCLPDGQTVFRPRTVYGNLRFVVYLSGDANGSGRVDGVDIIYLVNYLKDLGPEPDPLLSGDTNGDCLVNGLDVIYLVNYFKGIGPAPIQTDCE